MNRWLRNGPTVTIWLVLLALGFMLLGAGIGEGVVEFARHIIGSSADDISLRFLGKPAQAAIVFGVGFFLIGFSLWRLSRSSLGLTLSLVENRSLGQVLVTRQSGHGLPEAVIFSGHMGMLIVLNGVQDVVGRVTAVTPPGSDYRSIARLLRPSHPDARIISATAENAELGAELTNGQVVIGAADLEQVLEAPIDHLFLSSGGHTPGPTAAWPIGRGLEEAIASADVLIFGPGSFYTSVAPSLIVPAVRDRLASSRAVTIYICNVMTEPGRTDGWTVTDFIRKFTEYAGFAPRYTIVNRSYPGSHMLNRYEVTGSYPVMVTPEEHLDSSKVVLGSRLPGSTSLNIEGSTVIEADIIEVINENRLTLDPHGGTASEQTVSVIRHDSEKLSRVLRNLIAVTRVSSAAG